MVGCEVAWTSFGEVSRELGCRPKRPSRVVGIASAEQFPYASLPCSDRTHLDPVVPMVFPRPPARLCADFANR